VILNEQHQRVLRYVLAANTGGYRPSRAEVEEWRLRPDPLPGQKGRMISAGAPGTPAPWMRDLVATTAFARGAVYQSPLSAALQGSVRSLFSQNFLGTPGVPATYEPDGPPEAFLDHMVRLSWLSADSQDRLSLTPLGRALLRAEEARSDEASEVLVLSKDDPLAYGTLLGHIAESGDVMIVDPT